MTIPLDAKLGKVLSHGLELAGAGVVLLWRHASPLGPGGAQHPAKAPSTPTQLRQREPR